MMKESLYEDYNLLDEAGSFRGRLNLVGKVLVANGRQRDWNLIMGGFHASTDDEKVDVGKLCRVFPQLNMKWLKEKKGYMLQPIANDYMLRKIGEIDFNDYYHGNFNIQLQIIKYMVGDVYLPNSITRSSDFNLKMKLFRFVYFHYPNTYSINRLKEIMRSNFVFENIPMEKLYELCNRAPLTYKVKNWKSFTLKESTKISHWIVYHDLCWTYINTPFEGTKLIRFYNPKQEWIKSLTDLFYEKEEVNSKTTMFFGKQEEALVENHENEKTEEIVEQFENVATVKETDRKQLAMFNILCIGNREELMRRNVHTGQKVYLYNIGIDKYAVQIIYYDNENRYVLGLVPEDLCSTIAVLLEMGWDKLFDCELTFLRQNDFGTMVATVKIYVRSKKNVEQTSFFK